MSSSDDLGMSGADWQDLERLLRAVVEEAPLGHLQRAGVPALAGDGRSDVVSLLQAAYLLLMDGRADRASLMLLAARGATVCLPSLVAQSAGSTAGVAAILSGWEAAGEDGAGRCAPLNGRLWSGRPPSGLVEVFAVWQCAAASREGMNPFDMYRDARAGVLLPEEPDVGDEDE